ncbi:MAG: hypothetical protein Tsb0020_19920 [Haliangiales bacterium]
MVPEDYDTHADEFNGVLDVELAVWAARLSARTTNITVILDCCHSGGLVRGGERAKGLDSKQFRGQERTLNENIWRRLSALDGLIAARGERWPVLDPDAQPHLVRIEAVHANRIALEISHGNRCRGALTLAWEQAMTHARGRLITWDALFERLSVDLATFTWNKQRAGLGGPRHRLLFQLDEAEVPQMPVVVRERSGTFTLRAGLIHGVRLGDRFQVFPEHVPDAAGAVDSADASPIAEVEVREVAPNAAALACVKGEAALDGLTCARAAPLAASEHNSGVAIAAKGAAYAQLVRMIEESPALLHCSSDGSPIAVIREVSGAGDSLPCVLLCDARGLIVEPPLPINDVLIAAVMRLKRAAILRALRGGEGAYALSTPFELRWWAVDGDETNDAESIGDAVANKHVISHDGARTDAMLAQPVPIVEGCRVLCEIENLTVKGDADTKRLFITIFDIDVDGHVSRRTRSAPTGLAIEPGETHLVGTRGYGRVTPLALTWPETVSRVQPPADVNERPASGEQARGLRSLVVIVADREHDIRDFETASLERYGTVIAPAVPDLVELPAPRRMRSGTVGALHKAHVMRYAVVRVDWELLPVATAGATPSHPELG